MIDINTVTYQEGDSWIIQGLEHDICVQGANYDHAKRRFAIAVEYEALESGNLDHIPQAPQRFWDMAAEQLARNTDND